MSICYHKEAGIFKIDTPNTTYAMELCGDGKLVNIHFGGKIARVEDLPKGEVWKSGGFTTNSARLSGGKDREEYCGWGELFFSEPCLKVEFPDHVRDLRLIYKDHAIVTGKENGVDCETLTITLADMFYALEVDAIYRIYSGMDIIDRKAAIRNAGSEPVKVENMQSAVWYVPKGRQYRLTHLSGRWGREYQIEKVNLTQTKIVLEARTGISGANATPWFAVDEGGKADESSGKVWFGSLQWSGNWRISVEKDCMGQVRITGGINDFDFSYNLKPGETVETPVFTGAYTTGGFGQASRMLHNYQRDYLMMRNKAYRELPVIYNAWWPLELNVNEENMTELAAIAAKIGVELFVMDDGWFSNRDTTKSGLGDWYPSKTKFPNGLKPMIEKMNAMGLKFGIWVEPEMVNPGTELMEAHPDWILHFPTREGLLSRNQYVLNLAREDVREFIFNFLDKLLSEHNLAYLKWDMNRFFSEPGWPSAAPEDQRSMWARYVWNLYNIFERLQAKYPEVLFENCASGGLRADLGMARLSDRVNRSDNQDPLDMLKLHEGYTYVFRAKTVGGAGHIGMSSINRRIAPLRYKAHIGMMGSLAVGLDLRKHSEQELEEIAGYIKLYKEIRPIIHNGEIYRLVSPRSEPYMAVEYVSMDRKKAVLFALGQSMQFRDSLPKIVLQGLETDTVYNVEGYKQMSGGALMEIGVPVTLIGDFDSKVIRIYAVE